VKLLLDTHILLWWLSKSPQLSARAEQEIAEPTNAIFVSAASIWEIRIKERLGKLKLPRSFARVLRNQGFEELPIMIEHAHAAGGLPLHHRDPFDRMLIAQAVSEGLTIVTHDRAFEKYGGAVLLV